MNTRKCLWFPGIVMLSTMTVHAFLIAEPWSPNSERLTIEKDDVRMEVARPEAVTACVFGPNTRVSGTGSFGSCRFFGEFAPGHSPGVTTGSNQAFGGVVEIELGGLTPGNGPNHHDQINDAGTIELFGPTLQVLPYEDFVPQDGDEFTVLTWQSGLLGDFRRTEISPWFLDIGIGFQVQITLRDTAGELILVSGIAPEGDVNGDLVVDDRDIDRHGEHLRNGDSFSFLDLNRDGRSNEFDRIYWVHQIMNTYFGDANLDGTFASGDLIAIFQSSEYEDDIPLNSAWTSGDWNGDGDFDSSDLILAFQDGGFEQGPKEIAAPEPFSTHHFACIFLVLTVAVRWQLTRN